MNKSKYVIILLTVILVLTISISLIFKLTKVEKVYKDDYSVPLQIKGSEKIQKIIPVDIEDFKKNIEYYMIYNNLQDGNIIEYVDYNELNNNYIIRLKLNDNKNTIVYSKINKLNNKYYFFKEGQDEESSPPIHNVTDLLKKYDGNMQYSEIKNEIVTFIHNLEKIYDNTKDNSNDELKKLYEIKTKEINEMGISSESDFQKIQNQVIKAFKNDIEKVNDITIALNEVGRDEDYFNFGMVITYNNWEKIELICQIPNDTVNSKKIVFMSK